MDYQTIITSHTGYFNESSFILDILNMIGWALVKFLSSICNAVQSLFDSAYKLLNFSDSVVFKSFLSEFSFTITIVLTISFIAIGLTYMFSEKKPQVLKNLMIGLGIIYVLPQIITTFNSIIISSKNYLITDSYANQTVFSNVEDLAYIANNNFDFGLTISQSLAESQYGLKGIDPAEHLKSSDFETDIQKQVFNHKIATDDLGNVTWEEIGSKGWFDIFDPPYYYRYNIHYLQIFIVLIADILVLFFSSYAVIRMLYEIITTRIIAAIMSMELTSGQKTVKVIEAFFNSYIVLFAIPVLLKIYLLYQQYINGQFSNLLIRSLLILFGAIVVIGGPASIEKLFGYDMGISQGAQKTMAFMRMAQQARMQRHFASQHRYQHKLQKENAAAQKAQINNSQGENQKQPNINSGQTGKPAENGNDQPNINLNSMNSHLSAGANHMSEPNINHTPNGYDAGFIRESDNTSQHINSSTSSGVQTSSNYLNKPGGNKAGDNKANTNLNNAMKTDNSGNLLNSEAVVNHSESNLNKPESVSNESGLNNQLSGAEENGSITQPNINSSSEQSISHANEHNSGVDNCNVYQDQDKTLGIQPENNGTSQVLSKALSNSEANMPGAINSTNIKQINEPDNSNVKNDKNTHMDYNSNMKNANIYNRPAAEKNTGINNTTKIYGKRYYTGGIRKEEKRNKDE